MQTPIVNLNRRLKNITIVNITNLSTIIKIITIIRIKATYLTIMQN